MAGFDYDIGIIGGGAAGLTVASGAAQLGAKTLLVEREKELGGDCLHFGCVPSKTLIRSAQVYHTMKNATAFGLPQVEVPPVDFRQVADRIRAVVGTIQKHDSVERFCTLGAQVCFGAARFKDEHAIELNGHTLSAKSWVIATGSSAVVPPIDGLDQTEYLTNRDIFYMDRLPASMIILGGGPIGIEMAQAFNRLGTKVSVIDMAPQILGKEDRDMAEAVMGVLQAEGVAFRLNSAVSRVRQAGDRRIVTLQDADGQSHRLEAEALLVAIGRVANVEGLGLEGIGIDFDRQGIKTDDRLRTTHKHIYAAGDINGGYQFTHAAGYEGGIVVSNAVFRLPRKTDYTHIPWCTYTDPELASIGMNEKAAQRAGIDYRVWSEPFGSNDRSLAEGERTGQIKLILDAKEKPLGVQILGPHAGELLNEWVAIFNGKVKLATLAGAVHPYPTIGEINKRVAGNVYAPKIFSDKVKKGLKFFFSLKGRACEGEQEKCLQDCTMEE
ncbi:MAG: FAD-dependent oxidoreductase [Desulfobacterales bacterium]|jgi:pyruvate/2-oxoglutarate dehydrogenase complex dihydrolipoamide dehydrogenase (E3) component